MAGKKFTDFALQIPIQVDDYIVGYKADGTEEIKTTVNALLDNVNFTTISEASGKWDDTYTTVNEASGKWGTNIPLSFGNLNNYDVPGDSGVRNLGDLVGMSVRFYPEADFVKSYCVSEDDTNWYFDTQLQVPAQYGGVTIDIGFNLLYSSFTGAVDADILGTSNRFNDTSVGSNYEVHYRRFQFFVPKTFNGTPVNYIRLNLIARRDLALPGATGIINGGLIKFLTN